MKKTLLLSFIHGFKGTDETFANFPSDLRALLSHAFPNLTVTTAIYPKFETRGDLRGCVNSFTEWLRDTVIDLEVTSGTPSPTVEPSVRTILIGHSMGGIVAAEAVLGICREKPIVDGEESGDSGHLMFPYIQGVLAFDTPYLGISPGVVAHGAEGQWKTGKAWYETAAGMFAAAGAKEIKDPNLPSLVDPSRRLPPPPGPESPTSTAPAWERWGKYALAAGAASVAIAGAGAAAYVKRDTLVSGWTWAGSHLEFVGCLARGEELKRRFAALTKLRDERRIGFADIYTALGEGARKVQGDTTWSKKALGDERTFCILPKSELKTTFVRAVNDKAPNEIEAHMYMFGPQENPGYYSMSETAKELVTSWVQKEWYEGATVVAKPDSETMAEL